MGITVAQGMRGNLVIMQGVVESTLMVETVLMALMALMVVEATEEETELEVAMVEQYMLR
jgi:hypothetical protein